MKFKNEIQKEDFSDTIPKDTGKQQQGNLVNAPDSAPQGQGAAESFCARDGGETVTAVREKQTEKTPFLVVKFNHENYDLTREEAIIAAQKGLFFSRVAEKLDRLAVIKGQTVEELIDGMIEAEREEYKNSLSDRFAEDNDTVERLMKLYDIEQNEKYGKMISNREKELESEENELRNRLNKQFKLLKNEFPLYGDYDELPFEVRNYAEGGKDLMFAYLLYKYNEEKRTALALEAAKTAAAASVGSLKGEGFYEASDLKAFKSGLWGK